MQTRMEEGYILSRCLIIFPYYFKIKDIASLFWRFGIQVLIGPCIEPSSSSAVQQIESTF